MSARCYPDVLFLKGAADQDPGFKRVFCQEILQDMKDNNKLVIVITHDDRYFDCADRVVFMEDGRVVGVKENDLTAASSKAASGKALSIRARRCQFPLNQAASRSCILGACPCLNTTVANALAIELAWVDTC